MVCLFVIIFFLTLSVCLLYRKHRRLREYVETNRYLSCALKHTNDSRNKTSLDNERGEMKITLTIFQKKKDSVIHLEPQSVSQSSNQIKRRHFFHILPSNMNPDNSGLRTSLSSGTYVISIDEYSSKAEPGNAGELIVYITVLND